MERELLVYVDLAGTALLAGRLWSRVRNGRESASFEYAQSWRQAPSAFALDPVQLPLVEGTLHAPEGAPLFSAFSDGAPDRWGRMLLRRAAQRSSDGPRTLFETDFLTRVDDESRQGAYRYRSTADTEFLAAPTPSRVPPLLELPRLLRASQHVIAENETAADLKLLLAPGSSLGGARPKASVRDADGTLLIAKFSRKDDDLPVNEWEHVAMTLARRACINVAASRLANVGRTRVVLHRRFDRIGMHRVPFVSALTMLGARDHEAHSYLEIADVIRRDGSRVRADLGELWRRLVFNILIANTDDHLRNHAFLWDGRGWCLSPAYDLNPTPMDIRPRVLSLAIDADNPTGDVESAMSVAEYFDLRPPSARTIVEEIIAAVRTWRSVARTAGLTARQMARMRSAFESAS